jgi:uncharacterized LabA/DUF88 family protein
MKNPDNMPQNYAFIDSQNLNLGTQKMGWKMDWRKFLQFLRDEYNVDKAYLFIGYVAENAAMYEQLHELGYLIVLKRTLEVKPHEGEKTQTEKEAPKPTIKGNVDAELVLYAMKEMPNYDRAIIVSGDGDFFALVEYLDQQQKLLKLMVPNWQFSTLLKEFEANIVRIDKLRRQLAYRSFKKRPSSSTHSNGVVK